MLPLISIFVIFALMRLYFYVFPPQAIEAPANNDIEAALPDPVDPEPVIEQAAPGDEEEEESIAEEDLEEEMMAVEAMLNRLSRRQRLLTKICTAIEYICYALLVSAVVFVVYLILK